MHIIAWYRRIVRVVEACPIVDCESKRPRHSLEVLASCKYLVGDETLKMNANEMINHKIRDVGWDGPMEVWDHGALVVCSRGSSAQSLGPARLSLTDPPSEPPMRV